jgi:hypothetical protein
LKDLVGEIKGLFLANEFLVIECFQGFIAKVVQWQEKKSKKADFS